MADDVPGRGAYAAVAIFVRNNGLGARPRAARRTLQCTCRGWPEDDGWEESARLCALHQLLAGDDDGGAPGGACWPWPWRERTMRTGVAVPNGGAAFARYARWRRAVTLRTRFFFEDYYADKD